MTSFYRNALIDGEEVQLKMIAQRDNSMSNSRLHFTCDVIGLTFDQCRVVSNQTRKLAAEFAESLAKDLQMTPTQEDDEMERAMQRLFGFDRREMIKTDQCVPAPYGCGGPAKWFRDRESVQEFRTSGLCQKCQDEVFGTSEGTTSEGLGNQDDRDPA